MGGNWTVGDMANIKQQRGPWLWEGTGLGGMPDNMTYDQLLNQTERGRREERGGLGEEEGGGKQGPKRVAAIQVLRFYFHI